MTERLTNSSVTLRRLIMMPNSLNTVHITGTGALLVRIGLSLKKACFSETQVSLILSKISELFPMPPKAEEIKKLCQSLFTNNTNTGA